MPLQATDSIEDHIDQALAALEEAVNEVRYSPRPLRIYKPNGDKREKLFREGLLLIRMGNLLDAKEIMCDLHQRFPEDPQFNLICTRLEAAIDASTVIDTQSLPILREDDPVSPVSQDQLRSFRDSARVEQEKLSEAMQQIKTARITLMGQGNGPDYNR
jgi:hypothetical protein